MTGALPPINQPTAVDRLIGREHMLPNDARGNPGLVFDRFFKICDPGAVRPALILIDRRSPLVEFCVSYAMLRATGLGLLGALHRRFEALMTPGGGGAYQQATFETRWRVVTGVGNEHPLENGFTFDRSTG